jgi:ElaB/YqjD/DUF883 family membrane-anchored ribosome-binding protein
MEIKNGTSTLDKNRLDALKESVAERAGAIKTRAISAKDAAVRGGGRALTQTGSLIKQHPIAAIGIAFGIGYLAMRLIRR